jgi:uncharacterized SAM-binding protein YcdF (DUF218 family)
MPDSNPAAPDTDAGRRTAPRGRRFWRWLQGAVYLLVLAVLTLVFTPAGDWLGNALTHVDPLAQADYIVVLGGNDERAVEAAHLFREGWAPTVIVTSADEAADQLSKVAQAYGVPEAAILVDRRPVRTADHPATIAQLPGIDPAHAHFIILTSSYHTSRSRAVFLKAGYRNVILRCPDWRAGGRLDTGKRDWAGRAADVASKLYETLAWALYKVRGWA